MEEPGEDYSDIHVPGGVVIAVIHSTGTPRPTLLVTDEAEDGSTTKVRRLRFFQPEDSSASGPTDELVSDHIQTEMLVRRHGRVVHSILRQPYHCLMVCAMCCPVELQPLRRAAVVGHGAGALSSFLAQVLRASVTAVDIDPAVVQVGRQYFSDRTEVDVSDAAEWVSRADGACYDAVLIDVNAAGGSHESLAAPPESLFSAEVVGALARTTPMVIVNVLEGSEADHVRIGDAFSVAFPDVLWLTSRLCSNHIMVAGHALCAEAEVQGRLHAWMGQQHRPKSLARALGPVCSDPHAVTIRVHPHSATAATTASDCQKRRVSVAEEQEDVGRQRRRKPGSRTQAARAGASAPAAPARKRLLALQGRRKCREVQSDSVDGQCQHGGARPNVAKCGSTAS